MVYSDKSKNYITIILIRDYQLIEYASLRKSANSYTCSKENRDIVFSHKASLGVLLDYLNNTRRKEVEGNMVLVSD